MPTAFHFDMDVNQLKSWAESVSQAVMIISDCGVVVAMNHPFQRLIRYSVDEIEGRAFFHFLQLSTSFQSMNNHVRWIQGQLLTKDGKRIHTDIHVLKKPQLGLHYRIFIFYPKRPSQNMFSEWISQAPIGMMILDISNHQLLSLNSLASSTLGIKENALYDPIDCSLPKWNGYQKLLSFFKNPKRHNYSLEIEWNRKVLMITSTPHSERHAHCFFVEEITKLKVLQQQLKYNNRLATIGQIAAGSAHEIRNPLTSIKGFLQVISSKFEQLGYQKEQNYVQLMLKEINRINHLVGELLLLSKPKEMDLSSVAISQVMKEILPIIKNEALLHNIRIQIDYQIPSNIEVLADGKLLKQVFLNLCKNAIESMDQDGSLTIRLIGKGKKKLMVEFHDTGAGIPKDVQKKIFEPFFTTKENGTGLGLPICKQIMKEIGGRISVSSTKTGTVFRVLLPLA